jgi:hypothetical protein
MTHAHFQFTQVPDNIGLCNKFSTENTFFSKVSSDMQRLQGIMGGIQGRRTKCGMLTFGWYGYRANRSVAVGGQQALNTADIDF